MMMELYIRLKVELKCASIEPTAPCAISIGTQLMLKSSVNHMYHTDITIGTQAKSVSGT